MSLEIVRIENAVSLKAEWRRLFAAYSTFYKRSLTDEVADRVWAWLTDNSHESEGVLALFEGKPVGLAHYRRQPRTGYGVDIGFLDDLFVDPEIRGGGVGRALIAHVAQVGRERGWPLIRWTTADDNYRARTLYDQVAVKTSWNLYELTV